MASNPIGLSIAALSAQRASREQASRHTPARTPRTAVPPASVAEEATSGRHKRATRQPWLKGARQSPAAG
jgi:hypothetical protein